jgi:DTW domain-containing protein YfiP
LIPERCLCEKLPRVRLPWRLLVLQHRREARKPTNTARLLVRAVEDASLVTVATRERPWRPELLGPRDERRLLLFPEAGATLVTREELATWRERPTCVVLVDGTWRQAGRIARRAEGVVELPRFQLPPGGPSRWPTRRAPRIDQLSTFETFVRLVALDPELDAERALESAFVRLVAAQQVVDSAAVRTEREPPADARDAVQHRLLALRSEAEPGERRS